MPRNKEMCQDYNKKSRYVSFFIAPLFKGTHAQGTFVDHATATIFLYNMGALNMKSALFDMRTALCNLKSVLCNMGVYYLIGGAHRAICVCYDNIPA